MQLQQLKVGEQAKIKGYTAGKSNYRARLIAMGLIPGTTLTVARIAPLGDPIEVKVRGFNLSLRKNEASILTLVYLGKEE